MRKVILFNMVTLDGYFEGPDHDINWHNVDEEFNQFAIDQLGAAGCLIFGRVTYQMMAEYWPTPMAISNDPQVATRMNDIPKLVFSQTLERADWQNTRLMKSEPAAELSRMKAEPGGDMFIFGSGNLTARLAQRGVIDEFRLMVNPVVLGRGTPMFQDITAPLRMRLTGTRAFGNGNVLLTYQPVSPEP